MQISLSASTIPSSINCISSPQQMLSICAQYLVVNYDVNARNIIASQNAPSVENLSAVWLRLNGSGNPDTILLNTNGAWRSINSLPIGTIIYWNGLLTSIPVGFRVCNGLSGALNFTATATEWLGPSTGGASGFNAAATSYLKFPIQYVG